MKRFLTLSLVLLCGTILPPTYVRAQEASPLSVAQQAVAQAGAQGKFSFIIFYRNDNDLTRAIVQVVTAKTTQQPDFAVPTYVQITNPSKQAIVRQFDVRRAPMPLTLVTAPNGAITGVFPQRVTDEQLTETFVSPAMSHCMKSMQEGKVVFLCVQTTPPMTSTSSV